MSHVRRIALGCTIAILACAAVPQDVLAAIHLEFRPANQVVNVGQPADLGLYAVSDNGTTQYLAAADVLFTWDPTYLDLLFNDNTGATPALYSGFPATGPMGDNINNGNDPPVGGLGYYSIQAFLGIGNAIPATPEGTLLTTFAIDAIAPTPDTVFSIVASAGTSARTVVYDAVTPNLEVQGNLGVAHITIVPEPASLCLLGAALVLAARRTRRA